VPRSATFSQPARARKPGFEPPESSSTNHTAATTTRTVAGLVTPPDSSAAEELAKRRPKAPVRAFNTTFAGTLGEGQVAGQPLDVFIAGDDDGAKETVAGLARGGGLNPIDVGPLRRARELEGLRFLHSGRPGRSRNRLRQRGQDQLKPAGAGGHRWLVSTPGRLRELLALRTRSVSVSLEPQTEP
jgi:hypothetical protein